MLKEIKKDGLRKNDKVFKVGKDLVKVRLEKKEILDGKKIGGPSAIAFCFSASVCDQRGKALRLNGDRPAILPHTVTIPLADNLDAVGQTKSGFAEILEPLVARTISWHRNLETMEKFARDWEKHGPKTKT